MTRSLISLEVEGHRATLSLARPEARNALSVELCAEITAAVNAVNADGDVRVLGIRGEGSVFCAGADLAAVAGPGALEFLPVFEEMLTTVASARVPTVAAIQGAALGGGLQLATVCDLRVVASDARLGIPSSKLGIVINFENVERLVLLVGPSRAREILMTGRVLTAAEAHDRGLVTELVEPDLLHQRAHDLACDIAALAPLSVQGAKRAIRLVEDRLSAARRDVPEEVGSIDRLVGEAYASADLAEGMASRQEKRPPRFTGA